MSPRPEVTSAGDASSDVAAFVARLQRRARLTAFAEACLVAAIVLTVASVAWILGGRPGQPRTAWLAILAGLIGAVVWMAARRDRWSARSVAVRAEAGADFRNALVTTLELEQHPERATTRIRDLVARQAAAIAARTSPDVLWPTRGMVALAGAAAALSTVAVAWLLTSVPSSGEVGRAHGEAPRTSGRPLALEHVEIAIAPPAYTGRASTSRTNPDRIDALAGSRVTLRVTTRAPRVDLGVTGRLVALSPSEPGSVTTSLEAAESGLLTLTAVDASGRAHDRRAIVMVVRADAPPEVAIEKPGTDLTAASAAERVLFAARATDDLGLADVTLHYTKVTGSGEQFSFAEGRLAWTVARTSIREWRAETRRVLSELGLVPGDLLVYYARATDQRPGAPPSISDSYVIEIGTPKEAVSGGFAVPPDEDRHGISLSALIQKTERLDARRATMAPAQLAEAARGLAVEQRMVRTEVLFLMGAHGHVDDEEEEAEHSNEIQEGRLENRGQAELRTATRLMTTAERHLVDANTRAALVDQRRALAALQRALSRQRYFLRTTPVRSRIDPARRLRGDLTEARSWERARPDAADTGRVDELRAVLGTLLQAVHASGPGEDDGRGDLAAIAARLLALDPSAPAVQRVVGMLVKASAPAATLEARSQAIRAATRAVLDRLREAPATQPAASSPTRAAVGGALVDALATQERRP